jgi:hypothetical protein
MSTFDEITKEKQRLGEALARVDAQREKLTSQLNELEATERVLARYSTGTQARKMSSAKMPTTGVKAAAPARLRGRRRSATAKSAIGSRRSPNLNDQVLALATGKTQQEITAACKGVRPNPCRRRDCPTQAGRPRRRARWEALCHTAERDGATRRGLRRDKKSAGRLRKEPVVVFASLRCNVDRASPSARHKG